MKKTKLKKARSFLFNVVGGVLAVLPLSASAQFTGTFTPGAATGSLGPTQAQINTAYAVTSLSNQVIVTAGIQSWTVPATGIYLLDVAGASGGSTNVHTAGLGARMKGEFSLTAGDVLRVLPGQRGESNSTAESGAGGGGSYVTRNNVLLIAAGGGGGATVDNNGVDGVILTAATQDFPAYSAAGNGGNGGATCLAVAYSGGGGGGYNSGPGGNGLSVPTGGGGGLSFSNGGTGGAWNGPGDAQGGFGGGGGSDDSTTSGGGGGGYSGGAGGGQLVGCNGSGAINRSGGGGGGSYNTGASQVNAPGANSGNGFVAITALCNVNVAATSSLICAGTTVTLTTNASGSYAWSTGNTTSSVIVVSPAVNTTYTVGGTGTVPSGCAGSAAITITVNATPTVVIASTTLSACLGQTVGLTASGLNTYTWSGANGNNAAITGTPSANTGYTVTGTNACGTASAAVTVTVSILPVLVSASSTTVCAAAATTLSAGGATTYTWMPGSSTQTNYIVNPAANTVYTVTGKTGNCQGVNTITITTQPTPTITVAASSPSVCEGSAVVLNASGAISYTWNQGAGSGPMVTVNPTISTLYTVIGTNTANCTSATSQVVVVKANPVISISGSANLVCPGGVVTLTATGAGTYLWINNNSGNPVQTVSPMVTTTYSVTGTNTANCSSTESITVSVFDPTMSVTSSTAVCKGTPVVLSAAGMDGYTWSTGSGFSSINVLPATTTTYTVTGSSTQGIVTCTVSGAVTVSVNPNPTVTATSTRTDVCKGESTTINAGGATTYTWVTALQETSQSLTISPVADQTYTVNGTNSNGCKGTGTIFVKVVGCVGIEANANNTARLITYPNPSSGSFIISADQAINLDIINELGQVVRTVVLAASDTKATVSDLASGVYFIVGKNENGSVNKKIIVAK